MNFNNPELDITRDETMPGYLLKRAVNVNNVPAGER